MKDNTHEIWSESEMHAQSYATLKAFRASIKVDH